LDNPSLLSCGIALRAQIADIGSAHLTRFTRAIGPQRAAADRYLVVTAEITC
jgi:hypothetical protein